MDLHEDSGLLAIREAGLFEDFLKHARYDDEDLQILDRFGNIWVNISDTERGRPEIDRARLRDILLDSIPAETIRWGCHLRKAEPGKLYFDHGVETGFDLIVGADGGWSKIRSLLCDVKPVYSGISGVEMCISNIDETFPALAKMVGNGSYFAFGEGDGRALMCQRLGDRSLRMYAFQKQPEDWVKTCGLDFRNADVVRRSTRQDYSSWAPQFLDLIDACDDSETLGRALYMLPPGLQWASQPATTVLGDAAHLMTPFAGEGVNAAMIDALTLARTILQHPQDISKAVSEYEAWMFPHAKRKTLKTYRSLQHRFSAGGCAEFKARVDRMIQERQVQPAAVAAELSKID